FDWLGFAEADPHTGKEADVNQAELSPNPGETQAPVNAEAAPAPTPPPAQPVSEPTTEPAPEPTPDGDTTPDGTDLTLPDAKPGDTESIRRGEPAPPTDAEPDADAPAETQPDPTSEPATEAAPESPPTEPAEPTPDQPVDQPVEQPAERPADGAAEATIAPDRPAIQDERDSDAAAVEPMDVRLNGRPLAREGLQIRTVRPEFAIFAMLTRAQRNPIVAISFGPDGRVKKAEFVKHPETKRPQDSGSSYFNEPVLNALYRWRAEGPRIEALRDQPEEDGANLETITVRIVLRR
ncbi:MAG: hypothetical protein AAF297_07190, partial [Planctomycetota bacterium]